MNGFLDDGGVIVVGVVAAPGVVGVGGMACGRVSGRLGPRSVTIR